MNVNNIKRPWLRRSVMAFALIYVPPLLAGAFIIQLACNLCAAFAGTCDECDEVIREMWRDFKGAW